MVCLDLGIPTTEELVIDTRTHLFGVLCRSYQERRLFACEVYTFGEKIGSCHSPSALPGGGKGRGDRRYRGGEHKPGAEEGAELHSESQGTKRQPTDRRNCRGSSQAGPPPARRPHHGSSYQTHQNRHYEAQGSHPHNGEQRPRHGRRTEAGQASQPPTGLAYVSSQALAGAGWALHPNGRLPHAPYTDGSIAGAAADAGCSSRVIHTKKVHVFHSTRVTVLCDQCGYAWLST